MPYKEHETKKLYYTIGEVSRMFDVNTSLIRFWEKEFEVLQPKKNRKGNRLFTPEDLENLKIIYNLVKVQGFTLQGAKEKLKVKRNDLTANQQVLDSLHKIKSFLIEIKENL